MNSRQLVIDLTFLLLLLFALITQTICAVELQNTTTSNIETDVELAKLLLRNLLEIQEKRLPSVINNEVSFLLFCAVIFSSLNFKIKDYKSVFNWYV